MYRPTCAARNSAHAAAGTRQGPGGVWCALLLAFVVHLHCSPQTVCAEEPPLAGSGSAPRGEETATFEPIIVQLTLNGEDRGDVIALRGEDELLFWLEDMAVLGLASPPPSSIVEVGGQQYAPLSSLPDVTATFDQSTLSITIFSAALAASRPPARSMIDLSPPPASREQVHFPRDLSAFLNYGVTYESEDPTGERLFRFDDRIGLRQGNWSFLSDSSYTSTRYGDRHVRLMSTASYEWRDRLQVLRAGDQYALSGELGSTVTLGGLGLTKTYRLDPYFLAQPGFSMKGAAALPSEVEVYLDGTLMHRQSVQPGEFEIRNFKSLGGVHTVDVVIRDPFGQVERITSPMYFSNATLQRGLHEYSYHAGWLREQFGVKSSEYGRPVLSAYHRYGFTENVNVGLRIESGDRVMNGGIQASWTFPRYGVVTASAAESSSRMPEKSKGAAGSIEYLFQEDALNARVYARASTVDYRVVGPSAAPMRYSGNASASYNVIGIGTLSLGHVAEKQHDGTKRSITSLAYSRRVARSLMLSTIARSISDGQRGYELLAGLHYTWGRYSTLSASWQLRDGNDTESLQVQKEIPRGEGLAYRALVERRDGLTSSDTTVNPGATYYGRYGSLAAQALLTEDEQVRRRRYEIGAAGAVVAAWPFWGFTRPVNDSFTFVSVDGHAGVPVLQNGEQVGTTDGKGNVIIPSMRSYTHNQIRLDAAAVPAEYSLSGIVSSISPSEWSGSCLSFTSLREQAIVGTVVRETRGKREPLEYRKIVLDVDGRRIEAPTGKGGEFYLSNLIPPQEDGKSEAARSCKGIAEAIGRPALVPPGQYRATVTIGGETCGFDVLFPESADVIVDRGEVICGREKRETPAAPKRRKRSEEVRPAPAAGPIRPAVSAVQRQLTFHYDGDRGFVAAEPGEGLAALLDLMKAQLSLGVEIEAHGGVFGADMQVLASGTTLLKKMKKELLDAGVAEDRIKRIENLGKSRPLCTEMTASCDSMNQRVVVHIVDIPEPELPEAPAPTEPARTIAKEEVVVLCDENGAFLSPGAAEEIADLIRRLWEDASLSIEVEAHSGIFGTEEQALATGTTLLKRVKEYLLEEGVMDDRFGRFENKGKSMPVCDETTPSCDRRSRRVVLRLVATDSPQEITP